MAKYTLQPKNFDLDSTLEELTKLSKECEFMISSLIAANPHWNIDTDARIWLFKFIQESNTLLTINLLLMKEIQTPEWWEKNHLHQISNYNPSVEKMIEDKIFNLLQSHQFSYFFRLYAEFEIAYRVVAENYNAGSCLKNGISDTVNTLFTEVGQPIGFEDIWNIFSWSRNTTHYGGFHTHKKTGTKLLNFNGKDFTFELDKPISFLDFDAIFFILRGNMELFRLIVTNPKLLGVPNITHPFCEVEYK